MARYNAMKEMYEEMTVLGIPALFTNARIDHTTVPKGLSFYEVRHDDCCTGEPVQIAKGIMVNHWGTILTRTPLKLPPDGRLDISPKEDWVYIMNGCQTVRDFMRKYPLKKEKDQER